MKDKGIQVGSVVKWNDPDNNECSGIYMVIEIKGDIYILMGSPDNIVEAIINELEII